VDTTVCEEIARQFVAHKQEIHGDAWVLLLCDNLRAHIAPSVKKIFGDGHVFLCFWPPNLTDALQPIDAAYGRSLRCAIGRLLDLWLMDDENMEAWETDMNPAQRRVLMSKIVAEATEEVLANEDMRVGCFERTGMLMTKTPVAEEDAKIRPQGFTKKVVIDAANLDDNDVEFVNETNAVDNEEIESGWTADDMDINPGDETIGANDIVVEEEVDGTDAALEQEELAGEDTELQEEILTTRMGRAISAPARFRI
jgi:hypothetical protein